MMIKKIMLLAGFFSFILLNACTGADDDFTPQHMTEIRAKAIENAAVTYGAQTGLSVQSSLINARTESQASTLGQIFNFKALLLSHNVLPPILTESKNNLNLDNSETIRLSDRTYKIVAPARFVTTVPSWRDYLYLSYQKPEIPNKTLLPMTQEERDLWDEKIISGWKYGIAQADAIFKENLSKLARDFKGMSIYHMLVAKNMISQPYVAKAKLGVTGDSKELHINDQVLRITANAGLQPDSHYWQPGLQVKKSLKPISNHEKIITLDKQPAKNQTSSKSQLYRSASSDLIKK